MDDTEYLSETILKQSNPSFFSSNADFSFILQRLSTLKNGQNMNLPKFNGTIAKLGVVVITGLSVNADRLCAQQVSTVMNLLYNDQAVEKAAIDVLPPKGHGANSKTLSKGAQLTSGTKLLIPPNTLVQLQSPGGIQNIRPGKTNAMEYTVVFTAKGENHIVNGEGAAILNKVAPGRFVGYDYRNTNGRGTTAASKATEFTFTDLSSGKNEKASIKTSEGTVHITDQRPVTINGEPVKNSRRGDESGQSVSATQSAGAGEFVSSSKAINYRSYEEAIKAIGGEISNEDEDDRADDLMCLGDLYIDMKKPAQAIPLFKEAYEYYRGEYGEASETLDAQLSLAEACQLAGDSQESLKLTKQALDVLLELLSGIEEDIKFVDDDKEAIELLCDDVVVVALLGGWACEIIGDEKERDELYKMAEEGCK